MDQQLGASSKDRLETPVRAGFSLTTRQRETVDLSDRIPGWGSDLDRSRRPGVPRDGAPELGVEWLYPQIPRQETTTLIHKSTEHGQLTPVFGTSCPPRGLSGRLRNIAYRFSEGRLARWMTLMFADRIDVVEDVVGDVLALRPPNVPKEMGLKSEWQYNRAALVRKAALVGLGVAAYVLYSRSKASRAAGRRRR